MNKYILDSCYTPELERIVCLDVDLYRFVKELNYTYGLKVFRTVIYAEGLENVRTEVNISMCNDDGFHICEISMGHNNEFTFTTPFYEKVRGRSALDRHTFTSVKLPSLMGTLKRKEVIPSKETVYADVTKAFEQMGTTVERSFGNSSKGTYDINGTTLHKLLDIVVNKLSLDTYATTLDMTLCKKILDNYDKADIIAANKIEAGKEIFSKGFCAIGASYIPGNKESVSYVIGAARMEEETFKVLQMSEQVTPFKRLSSLSQHEDYEKLLPIFAMLGTAEGVYKDSAWVVDPNVPTIRIPIRENYEPNLSVVTNDHTAGGRLGNKWNIAWIAIPLDMIL
jgi:hypothetical protein